MARELLSEGKSEKETREALQVEFDAARTTVLVGSGGHVSGQYR